MVLEHTLHTCILWGCRRYLTHWSSVNVLFNFDLAQISGLTNRESLLSIRRELVWRSVTRNWSSEWVICWVGKTGASGQLLSTLRPSVLGRELHDKLLSRGHNGLVEMKPYALSKDVVDNLKRHSFRLPKDFVCILWDAVLLDLFELFW